MRRFWRWIKLLLRRRRFQRPQAGWIAGLDLATCSRRYRILECDDNGVMTVRRMICPQHVTHCGFTVIDGTQRPIRCPRHVIRKRLLDAHPAVTRFRQENSEWRPGQ